ncbi:hypothetical protein F3Y22_tig00111983pilonHSYRG00058 [Hibiscus syriacus]|uniref:ZNF598/HEL2 PAH domain-containing protein n=1 Tax=Hibiscus syriacus TaxID=106335 RepID=A0A6A2YEH3_HIBSY|nr:hypothetical protein F3Y22_tig00111983pilonHSYRG00058 [Hibiscus syriacus]
MPIPTSPPPPLRLPIPTFLLHSHPASSSSSQVRPTASVGALTSLANGNGNRVAQLGYASSTHAQAPAQSHARPTTADILMSSGLTVYFGRDIAASPPSDLHATVTITFLLHKGTSNQVLTSGYSEPFAYDFPPVSATQRHKQSSSNQVLMTGYPEPLSSDFPPVSAAQWYKKSSSNHVPTNMEDVRSTNKSLVEKMRADLEYDEEKYTAFKEIFGQYCQGLIGTDRYLDYVQHDGLSHLVLDLAKFCPDVQKQKELIDTYNARVQSNGLEENGRARAVCGVKKGKGMSVNAAGSNSNDILADSILSSVMVEEQRVQLNSSNQPSTKIGGQNESLPVKVGSGDGGGGSKQRRKTSKFHLGRLGDDSMASLLDLKISESDPEPLENKVDISKNSTRAVPVRGMAHKYTGKEDRGWSGVSEANINCPYKESLVEGVTIMWVGGVGAADRGTFPLSKFSTMAGSNLKQSHCNIRSSQYLGEISALCFLHLPSHLSSFPYLLAGTGSQVLLYDLESAKMIKSFQVFEGIRNHCLAIGCSDNSVHVWDILKSSLVLQVQSPDRCLLYSMRLWGDNLEALRIASGTIYNEIIVWKVICQHDSPSSTSSVKVCKNLSNSTSNFSECYDQEYKAVHICGLVGHEGSIFRIVWSSSGAKLVSVSDDRSARIWTIPGMQSDCDDKREVVGPVLYGHSARIWDCCISDNVRFIGRGIWRCLYDPNSALLVTAGFDSAIKVHQLHTSFCKTSELEGDAESEGTIEGAQIITTRIPNSMQHAGLMDSKSEYVRSLYFKCEDTIYVATNHGYLYHALLSETEDVNWTELVRVGGEVPIVCMDLLSTSLSENHCGINDWIAIGDGKGNMTVVGVTGNRSPPQVGFTFSWSAGAERQLLGTYWCKSLGCRYVFTTDPRGILKLWKLYDPSISVCQDSGRITLIAEFPSSFGIRIIWRFLKNRKAFSFNIEEAVVLVCGDLRGNLVLFPLSKELLLSTSASLGVKISPLSYFKGAHGISTVSNISVARLSHNQIEVRTTGADGCLCYFEHDKGRESFEFIGMKQLKELSLIESVFADLKSADDLANCNYAAGFASTDFIIWNLITDAKVFFPPPSLLR